MTRAWRYKPFAWLVGYLDRAVDRIAGEVTQEGEIEMKDLQPERPLISLRTILKPNREKLVEQTLCSILGMESKPLFGTSS